MTCVGGGQLLDAKIFESCDTIVAGGFQKRSVHWFLLTNVDCEWEGLGGVTGMGQHGSDEEYTIWGAEGSGCGLPFDERHNITRNTLNYCAVTTTGTLFERDDVVHNVSFLAAFKPCYLSATIERAA